MRLLVEPRKVGQSSIVPGFLQLDLSLESVLFLATNVIWDSTCMALSTSRVAELRRKRRDLGLKQTNVWLGPDEEAAIEQLRLRAGLKTRSEVIQYALRQASQHQQKDN